MKLANQVKRVPRVDTGFSGSVRRAGGYLAVVGWGQVLVCSVLAALCAGLSHLTPDELAGVAVMALPATVFGRVAVALLIMGTLPGLFYVFLSFPVRAYCRWAMNTALLLSLTQCVVMGLLLLGNAVLAIQTASPVRLTIGIIVAGSPLALLVGLVWSLLAAREYYKSKER